MTKLFLLLSVCLFLLQPAQAELITYKAPNCKLISHAYQVKVSEAGAPWQNADVYQADVAARFDAQNVLKKTAFTYFDCSGKVNVVVTSPQAIRSVKVRPASYGIVPSIKGNTIEFAMQSNQYISVEINGNRFENLQIFANDIETSRPSPGDKDVLYYGPGVHNVGTIMVPSGKTIYIAGGAVVEGALIMDHVENVTIRGRGILTQLMVQHDTASLKTNPDVPAHFRKDQLLIQYSNNVSVSGIVEVPMGYSILVGQSKHVNLSDFKSFSSGGNADGIDVFCSEDVAIDHIYMRNSDDCIAIYGHRWHYYGNTDRVTVKNAILWADVAHPLLIGTHGDSDHPDTLQYMKFSNITVLDQHENQLDYQGCLSLNAGDSNLIRSISFDHVDIEDIRKGQLINLRVMFNHKYNTSAGRGIEDISFKNVSYTGKRAGTSIIAGYDETRTIKNITFENLRINGTLISDTMKGKPGFYKTGDMANIFIGEHVDGLKFIATGN